MFSAYFILSGPQKHKQRNGLNKECNSWIENAIATGATDASSAIAATHSTFPFAAAMYHYASCRLMTPKKPRIPMFNHQGYVMPAHENYNTMSRNELCEPGQMQYCWSIPLISHLVEVLGNLPAMSSASPLVCLYSFNDVVWTLLVFVGAFKTGGLGIHRGYGETNL